MNRAIILIALALCACRTRPWDVGDGGAAPDAVDLSVINATADLATLDLAVQRDFYVPPDLRPPPDLVPPHYCDGIFVFDEDRRLSFFDPKRLSFTDIAQLACPAQRGSSPFSMAVGRDGTAWVEYSSGELFKVDTYTAACTRTMFQANQGGFGNFGMGFALDDPGSQSETLYVANDTGNGGGELGSIDLNNLVLNDIGALPGQAELTGTDTATAELWGFFGTAQPFIARIDKASGATDMVISVAQAVGDATQSGYAFGAFGGEFYIFIFAMNQTTTVYRVDPMTRMTATVLTNTGRHIVGAGVSTCAPGM